MIGKMKLRKFFQKKEARMEKGNTGPQLTTILKLLAPLPAVVPLKTANK